MSFVGRSVSTRRDADPKAQKFSRVGWLQCLGWLVGWMPADPDELPVAFKMRSQWRTEHRDIDLDVVVVGTSYIAGGGEAVTWIALRQVGEAEHGEGAGTLGEPVASHYPVSVKVDAVPEASAGYGAAGSWGEQEHFRQVLALDDEESYARIPSLNDAEAGALT